MEKKKRCAAFYISVAHLFLLFLGNFSRRDFMLSPLSFETFKEIFNFTTLVEVFSGLMIITFAIYQALSKLLSNHGIFKKKKDEREQKEKLKRQEEYQDYLEKTAKKILN